MRSFARPRVAVFGYLSLDALSRDGARHEDIPGGGVLYAALGVLAAGGVPSLFAARTVDFSGEVLARLSAMGADLSGLVPSPHATRRAALLTEPDDGRVSPHHGAPAWRAATVRLTPTPPCGMERVDAAILCPMPLEAAKAIADALPSDLALVLDTSEAFAADGREALAPLLARADVFAPSLAETRHLYPNLEDDEAAAALSCHARLVVQTRGPHGLAAFVDGTCVATQAAGDAAVVDTTGAGDAVCGALAVATARGLSIVQTLVMASEVGARAVSGIGPTGLGLDIRRQETASCA